MNKQPKYKIIYSEEVSLTKNCSRNLTAQIFGSSERFITVFATVSYHFGILKRKR